MLIPIYIVILRWFENHYDSFATMFTGLVLSWDYDPDSPQPIAAAPTALSMRIGVCGYLAARRLFQGLTEVVPRI
jgi:hypothetical protein